MKSLAILGSTGSIGSSTVDVIASLKGQFRVVALAAGRNATLLAAQAQALKPELVAKDLKSSKPIGCSACPPIAYVSSCTRRASSIHSSSSPMARSRRNSA